MEKPEQISKLLDQALQCADNKQFKEGEALARRVLEQEPENAVALNLRVFFLRRLGLLDEARKTAEDALRLLPDDSRLLAERGFVEYDQKQYETAIGFLDKALAREPTFLKPLEWKLRALRSLRRFETAQQVADAALELAPGTPSLLTERGLVDYDQKRYEKAIEFFDQTLKHDPKNLLAWQRKIEALRKLHLFDASRQAADAALDLAPNDLSLLVERGFVEYDENCYEKAIGFFERVLRLDPKHVDGLRWKTAALRHLKRYAAAQQAADAALELVPGYPSLLVERGFVEYDQTHYEKAIEFFDQVLERDPKNVDALTWKAASLRKLERYDAAREAADAALELVPGNPSLLVERGFVSYDQKQYDRAVEFFDQVLETDPKNVDALTYKVNSLRRLRRFGEAQKAADAALKLVPDNVSLFLERAFVESDQIDYEKALGFVDEALNCEPHSAEALEWKVICLRLLRRFEAADKVAESAIALHPKNAGFRLQRGWAYLDQEDFAGAKRLFCEAAALAAPDDHGPLLGQAEILMRQNRSDEAVELLRNRLKTFPDNVELRTQLGWSYIKRNDPLSAQREFETVLAQKSTDTGALNGLGGVYFNQEDYEKAEKQFRKVVELEPYEAAWHTNLAWSLARQESASGQAKCARIPIDEDDPQSPGEPWRQADCLTQAEQSCRKALDLHPNYAVAFGCLGVIAFKRGQFRESEDRFLQSIRASKRDGSYVDLAALYVIMGRYAEAEVHLKTALELDRDDVLAHIELGNLLLQQENAREAIREFRQAVGIDQNSESALRALALALIQSEALDEAEKLLRNGIRRMDRAKRWSLHLTLGQLLEKRGDETEDGRYYDEGLAEINKAIDLKRNEPQLHFQAGILRSKAGDYASAMRSFKRCLRLDKNHFEAERNLSRIKPLLPGETVRKLATAGGVCLGAISLSLLAILWLNFFNPKIFTADGVKISDTTLITMTPIFLGLIVVGLLLPALIRLKLPGVEAELSQPKLKETLAVGPKGASGFGSSLPNISSGPR